MSAGDPATFWYRSEVVCLRCLPRSRRWASFVGPVTVTPLDQPEPGTQGALFTIPGEVTR